MLILTPNRRLAAFLLQQYNQQQFTDGKLSWQTPDILRLEDWLVELWRLSMEHTQQDLLPLLSKTQQQILWEQIIPQSSIGVELLRINATAKNALQAWKFLHEWQIPLQKLQPYTEYSPDVAAFYVWAQSYMSWLEENKYLDFPMIVDRLLAKIDVLSGLLPTDITLRGFDDIPPQYAKLFTALKNNGVTFHDAKPTPASKSISKISFLNSDAELQAAAIWAAQQLTQKSDQLLGVVVPNLESQRQCVERIFCTQISPELMNISAPASLVSYGMIDYALLLLQCAKPIIDYEDFSQILRSPFIYGSEVELDKRGLIDRELRENLEARVSWEKLGKVLLAYDSSISGQLETLQHVLPNLNGKNASTYWSQQIQNILNCWGWPAERELGIEEADLFSCWQELLHSYCQLEVIIGTHTFSQALQLLQRLAAETPFLPAETGMTRVHVLGVLEAAGITFDNLWITGMSRDAWPPDASPNPFIPAEILRHYDMPRSSPQRELKLARRLTATLQQGGKESVIFSYPLSIDDNITDASNLIAHLPQTDLVLKNTLLNTFAPILLEQVLETYAPALELNNTSGGSNILKLQAQCPFKAFAEIRLHAKPLQQPQLVLTAAQRGNIVHEVLEQFWLQCKTHSKLTSWLAEQQVEQILISLIDKVLGRWQWKMPYTITENYKNLESIRLQGLIKKWLVYELQRQPFAVLHIEQKIQVSIGPLQFNLRVDRVDQLQDANLVVIDYKTGFNQVADWFSEPLVEPQLPLYAICSGQEVVAVVIANIQAAELEFKGVSAEENLLPNVKDLATCRYANIAETWGEQLDRWQQQLIDCATDFAAGLASVTPYSKTVCERCKLQALCRIYDC